MKEYNKPVQFDGDIIITDPCYVMRKGADKQLVHILEFDTIQKPKYKGFFSCMSVPNKMPSEKDYEECVMLHLTDSRLTPVDIHAAEMKLDMKEAFASFLGKEFSMEESKKNFLVPYSETFRKEKSLYMEALSVYEETRDDWSYCQGGSRMERLGIRTYLCNFTCYGDWSCSTYNTDNKEIIGQFCSDSGKVGVFLLDEVLKYNPDFDYYLNRKHTTTWIKDFHGTVELHRTACGDIGDGLYYVNVIGKGNVNFQTDLKG